MTTTFFNKKDGNLSSMRTTSGVGNGMVSFNSYFGSNKGGVTFRSPNSISRLNSKGECLGIGIKTGKHITYFSKDGHVSNHVPDFR